MKILFNDFILLNETKVKSNEKVDIYRDENYVVVEVLTHRASCKYGAFTQWCISVPSDSTAWNAGKDVQHIIFIINKKFKPNNEKISELAYLNDCQKNGELDEEDHEKYLELLADEEAQDLSKIAVIISKHKIEIWDSNNIDLSDVYPYGYKYLPIDEKVIDAIDSYLEIQDLKKYNENKNDLVVDIIDNKIYFYYNNGKIGYVEFYYDGDSISEHLPNNEKEFHILMIKIYDKYKGNHYSDLMLEYIKKYAKTLNATIITLRVDYGLGFGNKRNPNFYLEKIYLKNGFKYSFSENECLKDDTKNLGAMEYRLN